MVKGGMHGEGGGGMRGEGGCMTKEHMCGEGRMQMGVACMAGGGVRGRRGGHCSGRYPNLIGMHSCFFDIFRLFFDLFRFLLV